MAGITWLYVFYFFWSMLNPSATGNVLNQELGNQQHLYDSYAEVHCQFRSITFGNTTEGYLRISSPQSSFEPGDYSIAFKATKANGETTVDSLSLDQLSPTSDGAVISTLKWTDLMGGSVYVTIENKKSGESWEYEWLIEKGDPLILKHQTGNPVFENYILQKDTFQIISANPDIDIVYLFHYRHNFEAARPPISGGHGTSGKNLSIDSIWSIKVGTKMRLEDPGLYFVQSDSTSLEGLSFRVVDSSYPKPGNIKSLVAPLKYITTKSEYGQLQAAEDPKKAFDKFWLENTNDERLARENIRAYFQRFAWTNQVFTNYKEGWKTDRGLIYIIFGLPADVRRLPDREEWTYPSFNDGQVVFTFMKVPNIFTNQHYELVRNSEYDNFWFATVDAWRTGGLIR